MQALHVHLLFCFQYLPLKCFYFLVEILDRPSLRVLSTAAARHRPLAGAAETSAQLHGNQEVPEVRRRRRGSRKLWGAERAAVQASVRRTMLATRRTRGTTSGTTERASRETTRTTSKWTDSGKTARAGGTIKETIREYATRATATVAETDKQTDKRTDE